jgi:hypothetical protein
MVKTALMGREQELDLRKKSPASFPNATDYADSNANALDVRSWSVASSIALE